MTDEETLKAAANRLDELLFYASKGPWTTDTAYAGVHFVLPETGDVCCEHVARMPTQGPHAGRTGKANATYMAVMGPQFGAPLAALFRQMATYASTSSPLPDGPGTLLALARQILTPVSR